jgi:hypothetical protein
MTRSIEILENTNKEMVKLRETDSAQLKEM